MRSICLVIIGRKKLVIAFTHTIENDECLQRNWSGLDVDQNVPVQC